MSDDKNWKHLDQYVDLYKFHWNLAIKLCIFILGFSGAIAAYVIKNQDVSLIYWALFLPMFLCFFGFRLSRSSLPGLDLMRSEAVRLGSELKLVSHPEFRSLISFVNIIQYIFALTLVGLMILLVLIKHNL
jgi:hypothetical protein